MATQPLPETVDTMLEDMERVEKIRAYLESVFGAPVHITVAWNGETFQELYRKDVLKRMREFAKEYQANGGRHAELGQSVRKSTVRKRNRKR